MRILFFVQQFWPYVGGLEIWASRLLPPLAQRGHEIIVVTSHAALQLSDTERYKGIEVFRLPLRVALESRDIRKMARLRRQVADLKRTFAPDLIHVNLTGPIASLHPLTADTNGPPTLVSLHDPLEGRGAEPDSVFGRILRSGDWVTAGSMFVLGEARELVPEILSRSSLIYQGFDAPPIPPAPLPIDPPRLLCIGRLIRPKAFDVAIAAFAQVRERFPRARLTIASDGPEREPLKQQARELGLADAVEFQGWIEFDRMPSLLNSATMVLVPSRAPEGFGLVALEAALMARPVVATRSGALPEVIEDGVTGLLVEKDDPRAMANAISGLLAHPDMAASMGEAGRRRAQTLFALQDHIDSFDALYRGLCGRQAPLGADAAVTRATAT
jgi:glycogen(starch) synthase